MTVWRGKLVPEHLYRSASMRVYEVDGVLHWKNGKRAGLPVAPTVYGKGYQRVEIDGQGFFVHRMIWFMRTGSIPRGVIDHINDNAADNRFENLRDVPPAANNPSNKRKGIFGRGGPGPRDITPRAGRWCVSIYIGCHRGHTERCHLGTFESELEARAAYAAAKKLLSSISNGYASLGTPTREANWPVEQTHPAPPAFSRRRQDLSD